MSESLTLTPPAGPFDAEITPPGSKSLTNRAMVLAALGDGASELRNALFADDTLVMMDCLGRLGFRLDVDRADHVVRVHGRGGQVPHSRADLFCGNSGTTIRFVTALCAAGRGRYNLDGIPRMRQRPIGELVDLLRHLGVRVGYVMERGFPPVEVLADGLPGGIVRFGGSRSSQFLSAVLQVAPYARNEVQVDLDGPQTSWPYVAMTMRLMDEFGVTPELIRDPLTGEPRRIIIPHGEPYRPTDYAIEPDASNATYFLAAAAISPGSRMVVKGLGKDSLQGDIGFAGVLRRMGAGVTHARGAITVTGPDALEGVDVDLAAMPDAAQTLAVAALFADGPTTIRGLHTLRVKETDRIAAVAAELAKLGAEVDVEGDALTVHPPERLKAAAIDTYDDHRMAMSFALAGLRSGGVRINDPSCVNKTYPGYFDDLRRVTGVRT
ncbi:MAG: 3-phosphoshikimate 1-carboxyvinyltransferase [uncultured Phycisphaerae bacterium]|uniref:3-phosphoshikimate 1-carboxyvinyltransferase n=1 Tax=uncultured Phycisphaerae bacterium TaxID=904963 RepID=A0A6J4PA01_9BACT|nr:MAG: 3-phosphoshikimate 1-carboxyvinyltransferase [uncultured Phycisphaerae bacterium]